VEIGLAVELHLLGGGGVTFGTGTLPHGVSDRLSDTYSVVAKAWNSVSTDYSVRAFRKAHGWWGFVRTCEVTYGRHGWHPHIHWIDFWEGVLSSAERAEYRALVYRAWSRSVVRQGQGRPSVANGVVVLDVRDGEISDYMTKLTPMAAGHELTSITTKQAKQKGLGPFDILCLIQSGQRDPWTARWWEYEQATRGRRMLGATPRLLARLGLASEDPDVDTAGRVVAYVASEDWGRVRFFGGGVQGVQLVIERAAEADGAIGVREAMRVLLGGAPVELLEVGPEQLVLGPGDDGGMF